MGLHLMYYEMGEMWDKVPRPDSVETVGERTAASAEEPKLPEIPESKRAEFEAMRAKLNASLLRASRVLSDWAVASRELLVCSAFMRFLEKKHDVQVVERLLGKYQLRLRLTEICAEHPGFSLDDAADALTDALRYVVLLSGESYSGVVRLWVRDMRINGYALDRVENRWPQRRGIVTVWLTPHRRAFQVHFHTADSYESACVFDKFGAVDEATTTAAPVPHAADTLDLSRSDEAQ
eukprot:Amastigsp_a7987_33.p1 type:complete len:236 gc:universal Amastigsp_a7987_33:710-3(-)